MTIREAVAWAIAQLESGGIAPDEARSEARLLVRHAAGLTPEALHLRPDAVLSPAAETEITHLAARRARREPLAYLLGEREFYGLPFHVSPSVLIPRPETEFLVEAALTYLSDAGIEAPRIIDIGTGSGALAVAIAANSPHARVWGTDISPAALRTAAQNVVRHNLADRVRLVEGDLFALTAAHAPFNVIVSNPPYIAPEEIKRLEPEVRDWEPRIALGTHADPLHFYRRLASDAPLFLAEKGLLAVEVGQGQADAVRTLWENAGFQNVSVIDDYAGIGRVVTGHSVVIAPTRLGRAAT